MGVVFRAEDTRLRRVVALKFLPEDAGRAPDARARFLREAQAAAILDHPNICPVYEVDESEGRMFLTMAFIEGRNLKDRIADGPMPLVDVLEIATHIAEGLAVAHEKGVVHRDIKPANIMISREGQVRITDFGLASLAGGADLTHSHVILGTAPYMSPEQVRGDKADARTDIWSFGCTLYEMATGRRPFQGERGEAVLYQVLHETPQRPSSLRDDVTAGLEDLIVGCLRKEPADRFPDFHGVVDALKRETADRKAAVSEPGRAADVLPSLAVLPFADMSAARDHEYFGEGLAEELIHALARIQGIRVVARTSAFALKGLALDVRDIGKRLGVGAVLEGSIRKAGNRLRVTAQLIDATTGLHLWSDRFDREEVDVFDIQDEISLAIVQHLKVTLLSGEKSALQRRATGDPEAYNLYLRGLYFVARPSPESLGKALSLFRDAIERDPAFALAHAGVATVFFSLTLVNLAPADEMYPKAKAALEKALSLDPNLAEAHAVAAVLAFWFEWNWAAAEESFRRALAINPGDAMSRGEYAFLLLSQKRFDESFREIRHALTLDPLMPLFYAWSIALHTAAGRPDEALQEFSRLLEIDPGFGLAYFHAGLAYYRKGLYDAAIATLEKGRQLVSYPGWHEGVLALCYLRKGEPETARQLMAATPGDRDENQSSPCNRAWYAGIQGDLDAAFRWLGIAIERREAVMPHVNLYAEALVPELVRDPRFEGILKRMHLPR